MLLNLERETSSLVGELLDVDIFHDGGEACVDLQNLSENPYDADDYPADHLSWMLGWLWTHREHHISF